MKRVLFVCTGNICRSPTAEGVFTKFVADAGLTDAIDIDSAGTHAYHIGDPPDRRSQAAAKRRGYELGHLRGRQVERSDFNDFDYVIAMDKWNLEILESLCPPQRTQVVKLFLRDFAPHLGIAEVPDPYYGGSDGFERVLDMIEDASRGLLREISGSNP